MIYGRGIKIWTARGWQKPFDLQIEDQVISYNPQLNYCEYDKIAGIETGWATTGALAIKTKGMYQWLTSDHPILIFNSVTKAMRRTDINSIFMQNAKKNEKILYNRWFEPYQSTVNIDDLKWSARVVATYNRHKRMDIDTALFWKMFKELGGYEAQIWLDTFFHWNRMLFHKNWMFTIELRNSELRDMLFHIAPRAGVGGYWAKYALNKKLWAFGISNEDDITMHKGIWRLDRIDGEIFNVATKNGNLLVRGTEGNFIIACEYK